MDKIEKQRSNIVKDIKGMTSKVKNYLERLELEVLHELGETSRKETARMDCLLEELKAKELCIQQLVTSISQVYYLPDIQNFLASKELETRLNNEEILTSDLCSKAVETDDQKIEQMISEIKKISRIHVSHSPIKTKIRAWKQQQAQISAPTVTTRQLEDIRLEIVCQIEFDGFSDIRGCYTLLKGKMIFANNIGIKLLVYNEDGRFCKKISTGRNPYGLAVIDSNTVAVSCQGSRIVQIIDINADVVKYTIKVGKMCLSLSYNKGKLYVLVRNSGIMEYDLDWKLFRTIPVDVPSNYEYMCCCSDGFCFTSWSYIGSRFIACCDVNGKELWKSDVGDIGVTVDNTGNIYVANDLNHSLSVISADGKRTKRLLSSNDGLCCPEGVYVNKENDTLLVVASRPGNAVLYRVV